MSENKQGIIIKCVHCFLQNDNPVGDIRTSRFIDKWKTTVENQIAHMSNICVFKMNDSITVGMCRSEIMCFNNFIAQFQSPALCENRIRKQLMLFSSLLFG